MSARFIKPPAIATLRAIVLAGVPAFLLATLPLNLPFGDDDAWISTALAESGSGSDGDGGSDDSGGDSDDGSDDGGSGNSGSGSSNSGSGSSNSGSGSNNSGSGSNNSGSGSGNSGSGSGDDDDEEFSGDPTPEGGNLSAEDELWLIQNGWQKAEGK